MLGKHASLLSKFLSLPSMHCSASSRADYAWALNGVVYGDQKQNVFYCGLSMACGYASKKYDYFIHEFRFDKIERASDHRNRKSDRDIHEFEQQWNVKESALPSVILATERVGKRFASANGIQRIVSCCMQAYG